MRHYFQNRFDPRLPPKPVAEAGWPLFRQILADHAWDLFLMDILTLLLCIPVITAPAAICALNRICGLLIRDGHVFWLEQYFREFRRSFWKALAMGILLFGFFLSGLICWGYGIAGGGVLYQVLGIGEILLTFLLGGWSFALLAVQELTLIQWFGNTVAMTLLEPGCDWKVLLVCAGTAALVWFGFPYTLFLLLIVPVLPQFTVVWLTKPAIEKRIIQRSSREA